MRTQNTLLALTAITLILTHEVRAQGSLTPPGAPGATMKTLAQLWTELQNTQSLITQMQAALSNQIQSVQTAPYSAVSPPITMTVDSRGMVGRYSSLAFSPAERPAISYYDESQQKLKFGEN